MATASSRRSPIHLVLRFGDELAGGYNTIDEHKKVLDQRGCVWFGKVGKPVGERKVKRLMSQIQEGEPTYLYLASRRPGKLLLHRGLLEIVQRERPKHMADAIPGYYTDAGLLDAIASWCLVRSLENVGGKELRRLRVATSAQPLSVSLQDSMAGAFFVKRW